MRSVLLVKTDKRHVPDVPEDANTAHQAVRAQRHADSHGLGGHVVSAVNDADAGQPKVCQLDMALAGNEEVVWLQVPVDDGLQDTHSEQVCTTTGCVRQAAITGHARLHGKCIGFQRCEGQHCCMCCMLQRLRPIQQAAQAACSLIAYLVMSSSQRCACWSKQQHCQQAGHPVADEMRRFEQMKLCRLYAHHPGAAGQC